MSIFSAPLSLCTSVLRFSHCVFAPSRLCVALLSFILSLCVLGVSVVQFFCLSGGSFPHFHHAIAIFAQRQHPPLFPPRLCHFGGSPRPPRRSDVRKILNSAALPVLPAIHIGGNFLNFINCNPIRNLLCAFLLLITHYSSLITYFHSALSP